MKLVGATFTLCLISAACFGSPAYPIKVSSANPRLLVDQHNNPFLLVGDSPWCLLSNINQSNATVYINDRRTNGFNTLLVAVLCYPYVGGPANGALLNGTLPFTGTIHGGYYNITNFNSSYFSYVDTIVNVCASNGIEVILYPMETGGWLDTMTANGTTACYLYGQYIGNRYKNFTNIIWASGNDYFWDVEDDPYVTAVASGIQSQDTNHLQTLEIDPWPIVSLDDPAWDSIVNLNWAYTYYASYAEMQNAFENYTNIPLILGETWYDGIGGTGQSDDVLRRQEWWAALSGESGQMYGNVNTYLFDASWQSTLDSPGVAQLQILDNLLESNEWYNLVPDIHNSFVTAGYGIYDALDSTVTNSTYVLGAQTSDGTLGIVYIPSNAIITVTMSRFTNTVVAQWFDPGSGAYSAVSGSPFSNTGSRSFATSSENSVGDTDWALLLKVLAAPQITDFRSSGNDFILSFTAVLGQNYQLQGTTNLPGGSWVSLGSSIPGNGGIMQITNTVNQARQFYRVKTGF